MLRSLFLIVPFMLIASSPVLAQSLPNLSNFDRQRLSRDLTPFDSQDFFRQGQKQLEREIRLLEHRSNPQAEPLLKVNPTDQNQTRSLQSDQRVRRDRWNRLRK